MKWLSFPKIKKTILESYFSGKIYPEVHQNERTNFNK